jgi:phosphoglycolate phosphatase
VIFDLDGTLWDSSKMSFDFFEQLKEIKYKNNKNFTNEKFKKISDCLYPGVTEVIPELSKKYVLYIVSNCQKGSIELFLSCSNLRGFFKDWLCYGDTLREKSENIKEIMKKHSIKKTIYVGDSIEDYEACKKIPIPIIVASYGFGGFENYNNLPVISNLFELPKILDKCCSF